MYHETCFLQGLNLGISISIAVVCFWY